MGFYLGAFGIAFPPPLKYLDEDIKYIENTFKSLQYFIYFIPTAQKKALNIHMNCKCKNQIHQ